MQFNLFCLKHEISNSLLIGVSILALNDLADLMIRVKRSLSVSILEVEIFKRTTNFYRGTVKKNSMSFPQLS